MINTIEIRKVANGYMIRTRFFRDDAVMSDGSDMHVFETFDSMISWLFVNFEGVKTNEEK